MAKKTMTIAQKKAELENALKRLEIAERIINRLEDDVNWSYGTVTQDEDGAFLYDEDGRQIFSFEDAEDPDNWRHDEYIVYKEMLDEIKDLLLQ